MDFLVFGKAWFYAFVDLRSNFEDYFKDFWKFLKIFLRFLEDFRDSRDFLVIF